MTVQILVCLDCMLNLGHKQSPPISGKVRYVNANVTSQVSTFCLH